MSGLARTDGGRQKTMRILFIRLAYLRCQAKCLSNPGQNAPNLLRRNVRLIQLGINRHKNDVCRCLEVVDQAIARTFAFPDIPVPHPHLEYGVVRPRHLITYNLACPKLVNHG